MWCVRSSSWLGSMRLHAQSHLPSARFRLVRLPSSHLLYITVSRMFGWKCTNATETLKHASLPSPASIPRFIALALRQSVCVCICWLHHTMPPTTILLSNAMHNRWACTKSFCNKFVNVTQFIWNENKMTEGKKSTSNNNIRPIERKSDGKNAGISFWKIRT